MPRGQSNPGEITDCFLRAGPTPQACRGHCKIQPFLLPTRQIKKLRVREVRHVAMTHSAKSATTGLRTQSDLHSYRLYHFPVRPTYRTFLTTGICCGGSLSSKFIRTELSPHLAKDVHGTSLFRKLRKNKILFVFHVYYSCERKFINWNTGTAKNLHYVF